MLYDTEVFYEIPRTEMRGQVVEFNRITHSEDDGFLKLSVAGDSKTLTFQENPDGPIERGDTVRAVSRDWLWIQSELVELEVLSGTEPGKRLDLGRHDVTMFTILMAVMAFGLTWWAGAAADTIRGRST